MNPTVRLATADDLRRYAGRNPPEWCVEWCGYVAERDGEIVALGMVFWDKWGRTWGLYDFRERQSPFLMHRLARETIAHLRRIGVTTLHAFCDDRVPKADLWLKRLGFRLAPELPPDPTPVWICTLSI